MSENFGNDFVVISDDDGNEFELEHLDTIDINGTSYMAFLPADMDEEDENFGLIILKMIVVDGEEILATLDDDAEVAVAFEKFAQRLSDDDEG